MSFHYLLQHPDCSGACAMRVFVDSLPLGSIIRDLHHTSLFHFSIPASTCDRFTSFLTSKFKANSLMKPWPSASALVLPIAVLSLFV